MEELRKPKTARNERFASLQLDVLPPLCIKRKPRRAMEAHDGLLLAEVVLARRPAQQIHVNAGLVRRDTILRQCVSTDSAASNHDAVVVPIDVCVIGSVPSPPRHLLMRRLGRGAQVFYFHSFVAAENCPCYRAQGITRVGSDVLGRLLGEAVHVGAHHARARVGAWRTLRVARPHASTSSCRLKYTTQNLPL